MQLSRSGLLALSLSVLCSAASAQDVKPAAVQPSSAFIPADVHPSPYSFFFTGYRYNITADRLVIHYATLFDLITTAYSLDADAVSGGPPSLEFDHFDIVAKIPAGTTWKTLQPTLQAILSDRFHLVLRTETKPLPSFLLRSGKGPPKMKPAADPSSDPGCSFLPPDPPPPPNQPPTTYAFKCHNYPMDQFAGMLHSMGFAYLLRPVVNLTELKGGWDFDIRYSPRPGTPDGISIFDAVDKLGLKLEPGIASRPSAFIASVDDKPTPNPPGLAASLPVPPATTFEVAVIKPNDPNGQVQQRFGNNGQVTFGPSTLQELISEAWDISGASFVNAPSFIDKKRWVIEGKLAHDEADVPAQSQQSRSWDDMETAMRSLLEERFGLKVHMEDRPLNAYTLHATSSPRLRPAADPTQRTSCSTRAESGAKDPRIANPLRNRYVHCENISLDQFAGIFLLYAKDYIKSPVLNATNLQGRYDISLNWSDSRTARFPPAPPPGSDASGETGTEPSTVISLQDALSKQLGLKLDLEKRPAPALVIDALNENPTDN